MMMMMMMFARRRPATNMYAANGPAVPDYNSGTTPPKQSNSYSEPRSAPGPSPNLSQRPMQPQTPPSFDDRCVFRVAFKHKQNNQGLCFTSEKRTFSIIFILINIVKSNNQGVF